MSRVAVVTGAGSGMGLVTAQQLAARGDKVALLDLNGEAIEEQALSLRAAGSVAVAVKVDVSDRAAVFAAMDEVRSQLGPIETIITSAGIEAFVDFLDISEADWNKMMAVNLSGTFHCLQAVIPDMLAGGWGRVVTISSSSAQHGTKRMASYARRHRPHEGPGHGVRGFWHHGQHHPAGLHRDADAPPADRGGDDAAARAAGHEGAHGSPGPA